MSAVSDLVSLCYKSGSGSTCKIVMPPDVLRSLYCDHLLSAGHIAKLIGAGKRAVLTRLREYGIPARCLKEAFAVSEPRRIALSKSGEAHHSWRGGTRIHSKKHPYIQVLNHGHPEANKDGYVFQHRLVAEEIAGRCLLKTEHVHHLNGDVQDNRPENLSIMSRSEHMSLHAKEKQRTGVLCPPHRRIK